LEFIEKYIDKPWYWGENGFSINPNITLEFINRHIDQPWDWGEKGLSSNLFDQHPDVIKIREEKDRTLHQKKYKIVMSELLFQPEGLGYYQTKDDFNSKITANI
jgi:hypothetical protein